MRKSNRMLVYAACVGLSLFFLFPIFWMILSSSKDGSEPFRFPPTLFPEAPTIDSFVTALKRGNFALFFKNSTVIAILSTIVTVTINTMAGYAFTEYQFKGRDIIFVFFTSTLILPLKVLMIPIFRVVKFLGVCNTFLGAIIPPAATPAGAFLLGQYFLSIPDDLIKVTQTDGTSEVRVFIRPMLPIAKPAMNVLAIFPFMRRWNNFMWPLLAARGTEKYTLQLTLFNFNEQYSMNWNGLVAMPMVIMISVLIAFLIFQRQFIQGMVTSGIKE